MIINKYCEWHSKKYLECLWYLTDELIHFCLFDNNIYSETKRKISHARRGGTGGANAPRKNFNNLNFSNK